MTQELRATHRTREASGGPAIALCVALAVTSACGGPTQGAKSSPGGANGTAGDPGGQSTAGSSSGGSNSVGGSRATGGSSSVGGSPAVGGSTTVTPDGTVVTTALPMLPQLTNVIGTLREDSVGIDFDPVDGATDYRVYPLPKDSDITASADGSLTVRGAIYRCAGLRQTYDLKNSVNAKDKGLTPNPDAPFESQIDADNQKNTLGYVYVTPASDRSPVYALASHALDDENGWRESRLKVYTTSASTRQTLFSQGWRDDGIAFYVPTAASATTKTIYGSQDAAPVDGQDWTRYTQAYFAADQKAAHAKDSSPPAAAFEVLTAAAKDTKPLMTVLYNGSNPHTELVAGIERFKRAANQGNGPLWHVEWSGLTAPTTLVVEALKNGCPFQGFLSPQHVAADGHQTLSTLAELQKASATGEVFINGQYDNVTGAPVPLARSFLNVTPVPHKASDWDWYQGFNVGTDLGTATEVPGCTDTNCGRWQTKDLDISVYRLDAPNGVSVLAFGQFLGQLWDTFDDDGQDVTGKLRFTARTKANIDSDPNKYLHATMSVDIVSTDRRYPQLIITDQNAPVQEGMSNPNNNTVLVQPILGPSMRIEVQAFHGLVAGLVGSWDVNNQAPEHRLIDYVVQSGSPQPADPPFEHAGMDRLTKFDVYLSSKRLYFFLDGQPGGCTLLPSNVKLAGPVTYSVGDVLYHEGAADEMLCEQARPYSYMHTHQCIETKRHFDDLAFKSGAPPPPWDDTRFPCLPY